MVTYSIRQQRHKYGNVRHVTKAVTKKQSFKLNSYSTFMIMLLDVSSVLNGWFNMYWPNGPYPYPVRRNSIRTKKKMICYSVARTDISI